MLAVFPWPLFAPDQRRDLDQASTSQAQQLEMTAVGCGQDWCVNGSGECIDDGTGMLVDGRASHYNAAVQVFSEGVSSRVVWTIDLLPDELAPAIDGMMDQAAGVMKKTLAKG